MFLDLAHKDETMATPRMEICRTVTINYTQTIFGVSDVIDLYIHIVLLLTIVLLIVYRLW